ncbi:MAG TPA: hypothetical protein VKU80_15470 [Planctomycetota bacterium]|nr:hypothetical protein [Planctomycetota bacterium]
MRVEGIRTDPATPADLFPQDLDAMAAETLKDLALRATAIRLDQARLYWELRARIKRAPAKSGDRLMYGALGTLAKQLQAVYAGLLKEAEAERGVTPAASAPAALEPAHAGEAANAAAPAAVGKRDAWGLPVA